MLSGCTAMKVMDLSDNQIEDISIIANFPELINFKANNNKITGIPKLDPETSVLVQFSANYNEIEDVSGLSNLIYLNYVHVDYNKVKDISRFAKKWVDISDDGETNNSAYGWRIFDKFGFNQWQHVKELLWKDPNSRQAVIHIKDADNRPTKDVPCTVYLQFFIRNGKLNLSVHMRSNDIWMGVPYDMFSFTFLQMKMAMELGVEIGQYTHYAGSLHIYARDYATAQTNIEAMSPTSAN